MSYLSSINDTFLKGKDQVQEIVVHMELVQAMVAEGVEAQLLRSQVLHMEITDYHRRLAAEVEEVDLEVVF